MVVGLVVGMPLGLLGGAAVWRAFADGLGIAPTPEVPMRWLALVLGGAIAVALAVAIRPGRRAARVQVGDVLRAG
jgi:ABC-type lipoprotein release transport system permease subunit